MSDPNPDDDVDLAAYGLEDWIAVAIFWALAIVVFLQFFTRYVLNDSLAWTEEIARYLLIGVGFIGAAMATRRNSHIHVEFFYLYLSPGVARALSTAVDVLRIGFLAYMSWLAWKVTSVMQFQHMVVIEWPMSIVYGACFLGFAAMTLRATQLARRHWREGGSLLTRAHEEGRHQ